MGNSWTTVVGFAIGHKVMVLGWSLRVGDQRFRVWREEFGGALRGLDVRVSQGVLGPCHIVSPAACR